MYRENVTQPTAMISVDNREAAVAILRGTAIDYIDETASGVAGKHDAGGQSQRRFERNRIAELNKYYKRIATDAKRLVDFRPIELFMSGPADAKVKVYKKLDYRLRDIPVKFIDQEYSAYTGILQTINRLQ